MTTWRRRKKGWLRALGGRILDLPVAKGILLLLLVHLSGCGEGRGNGGQGDESQVSPPTALRSPDSLRTHEPLPAQDSFLQAPVTGAEALAESEAAPASGKGVEAGGKPGAPRPEHVRGIYLNAWTAGSQRRREALIDLANRTELNAFVIDIKDATGYVSHPTEISTAQEVGAADQVRIRDLPGLLARLEEAGIYPIARIVVAKDPLLTAGRPDWAIQDSAGGAWLDQDSVSWLNLYNRSVWNYHLGLAMEVVEAGFPEIQWDYVRFPDAPEAFRSRAVFPGAEGRTSTEAVRAFLGYTREALRREGVLVTVDVFGVTTSYRRDVGIGQVWESFIDQVDAALPMVYPSHYWTGSFGFENPNAYPYEIVRRALRDAVSRSAQVEGAGAVRPWLQDFSLGDPSYGAPEVRAQIQATYDAGVLEWVLWNPGSRYTESALIPKGGLPSWLEPVMRVGGEVVPISERFDVLGEVGPEEEDPKVRDTLFLPGGMAPAQSIKPNLQALPSVPLPDTGGVGGRERLPLREPDPRQ